MEEKHQYYFTPEAARASKPDFVRDKKYEGFSSAQSKVRSSQQKWGAKPISKEAKLDDEYILNLHQQIEYLEQQLSLLYYLEE